MANIRLIRSGFEVTDPATQEVTSEPALEYRVPHTSIDAFAPVTEEETERFPTARSIVHYDFGRGPMAMAFEESTEVIRGILRSLPGKDSDWVELESPGGEKTYFMRSGYVSCQAMAPVSDEEGGKPSPRTLVWFRIRTAPDLKAFVVAATPEDIETACEPPPEPAKKPKPTRAKP